MTDETSRAMFEAPLEWMGLKPEDVIEIATDGGPTLWELSRELQTVEGLSVQEYGRKQADITQLLILAGSLGGILQGLDVLYRMYRGWRQRGKPVRLFIRSVEGGEVNLTASSDEEAKKLIGQLAGTIRARRTK